MASIFNHILVPVDFTEKNTPALNVAKQLARQNQSKVTLLHVIETIEYAEGEEIANFYEKLKEKSRTELDNLSISFANDDVSVKKKTVMGKRGRGIVSYAIQHDVDLVVLSSHRVDPSDAAKGWGTLSYQVSIVCPCPVLLVK